MVEPKKVSKGFGNFKSLVEESKGLGEVEKPKEKVSKKKETASTGEEIRKTTKKKVEKTEESPELLFEKGISFKGHVESSMDIKTFKQVFGTSWQEDAMTADHSVIRLSTRHHKMLDVMVANLGLSKTSILNNIMNAFRYANWEHIQELAKENSRIEM